MDYTTEEEFVSVANAKILIDVLKDGGYSVAVSSLTPYITEFYERERNKKSQSPTQTFKNMSLLEFNKQFIREFIEANKKQPLKNPTPPPPITQAEISRERVSLFETEWKNKQADFLNAHSKPIPETPEFKDAVDEKMTDVEERMKQMIAERNYEVEQLNQAIATNYQNQQSQSQIHNWITGQSTSLKEEKEKEKQLMMKKLKIGDDIPRKVTWAQSAEKKELHMETADIYQLITERFDKMEREIQELRYLLSKKNE